MQLQYFQAGLNSFSENDYESAAYWLELAASNGQHVNDALVYWGSCCLMTDDFEKAVKVFQKLKERDPTNAVAWYGHGFSLLRLNRPEDAEHSLHRAIILCPDMLPAYVTLAEVLARLGKELEGRQILKLLESRIRLCEETKPAA